MGDEKILRMFFRQNKKNIKIKNQNPFRELACEISSEEFIECLFDEHLECFFDNYYDFLYLCKTYEKEILHFCDLKHFRTIEECHVKDFRKYRSSAITRYFRVSLLRRKILFDYKWHFNGNNTDYPIQKHDNTIGMKIKYKMSEKSTGNKNISIFLVGIRGSGRTNFLNDLTIKRFYPLISPTSDINITIDKILTNNLFYCNDNDNEIKKNLDFIKEKTKENFNIFIFFNMDLLQLLEKISEKDLPKEQNITISYLTEILCNYYLRGQLLQGERIIVDGGDYSLNNRPSTKVCDMMFMKQIFTQ